ncbi:hypothetical protein [Microbacterium sp.]|uniref:hypothetical protein n=1 Tax=Microbacterium sp. TaxID=51671 RepID=UPI0039E5061B
MRSSADRADAVTAALGAASDTILAAIAACVVAAPVVLLDGRSGVGKSSLARDLVARWPGGGAVQLVALDSLYPGWDGLDDGVEDAREHILAPHRAGRIGVWRRWDWVAHARAEAYAVVPDLPLVVEGSGLLTAATAPLGEVRVWLESPEDSRRERALTRDGDAYRPHWARWAAQERRHLERDDPVRHATHVFDVP